MIQVQPIREKDAAPSFAPFFSSKFIDQRLGRPGLWQGEGVNRLALRNPVDARTFARLLHGRAPNGRALLAPVKQPQNRVLGWRMTVSASPNLSALWALVGRQPRLDIERAFQESVRGPLHSMEQSLSRWDWDPAAKRTTCPGALFAKFRAGATVDQRPHLHTTVFLFNLAFQADQGVGTFDPREVRRQAARMHALSEKKLGFTLWNELGISLQYLDLEKDSLGMPRGPGLKFFCDPSFSVRKTPRPGESNQPLPSNQLVNAWQEKAQEWGWGPKQAARYVNDAQRIRRVLLWDTLVRQRAFAGVQAVVRGRQTIQRLLTPRSSRKPRGQTHEQQQMRISY